MRYTQRKKITKEALSIPMGGRINFRGPLTYAKDQTPSNWKIDSSSPILPFPKSGNGSIFLCREEEKLNSDNFTNNNVKTSAKITSEEDIADNNMTDHFCFPHTATLFPILGRGKSSLDAVPKKKTGPLPRLLPKTVHHAEVYFSPEGKPSLLNQVGGMNPDF